MNNADQAQRSPADMLIKSLQKNKDTVKKEKLESNRIGPYPGVFAVTDRLHRSSRESRSDCRGQRARQRR